MLDKKSLKQNKGFKIQLKKRLLKSFCKDNVGEYGRIRQLSKDNRGNYSIIISAILIISFLILSIALLNSSLEENESNKDAISSNQIQYIMEDYKRNLPIIEREALEELSEYVITNRRASLDSRNDLKKIIDNKLSEKNEEYYENYNIQIQSSIVGIENTSDPFSYKFKSYISSVKGDFSYEEIAESNVNCYNLKDPVPVLFCGDDWSFRINDSDANRQSVFYGKSLSRFLEKHNVENYSFYENASSPFIIKRCPYDPYKHHGDDNGKIMKNCRENNYYHESADGACYLCRLEGKCGCEHYGSSADGMNEILYLDPHGHKVKYGMSGF